MKTKELLERLSKLLSRKGSQRQVELKSVLALLGKLEKKEEKVKRKLAAAKDLGAEGEDLYKRLEDKLRVLRVQRAKGERLCRELEE